MYSGSLQNLPLPFLYIWSKSQKKRGVTLRFMDVVDLKRDIELLSERLGKTQDYL